MKTTAFITLASAWISLSSLVSSAPSYQATGPVLELTDSKIVIQKDQEKWEFARTPGTKITGELKVGSKVTIQYTMTAASVEVKPAKSEPAAKPAAKAKPAK